MSYPSSGGTYLFGRRVLGPWWGFTAGWGFVVGKTASCASMAVTFAAYAVPGASPWTQRGLAVLAVVLLTAALVTYLTTPVARMFAVRARMTAAPRDAAAPGVGMTCTSRSRGVAIIRSRIATIRTTGVARKVTSPAVSRTTTYSRMTQAGPEAGPQEAVLIAADLPGIDDGQWCHGIAKSVPGP